MTINFMLWVIVSFLVGISSCAFFTWDTDQMMKNFWIVTICSFGIGLCSVAAVLLPHLAIVYVQ